jgi:hypothetical protein
MTLAGCGSRLYAIELNNVGQQNILLQRLQWDGYEIAGDPTVGIRMVAIPAGGITTGHHSMSVAYPIPERVLVTWKPEGGAMVSGEFELRRQLDDPDSHRDTFLFEFDGPVLHVYAASGSTHELKKEKLIAEVR